jgi:hypothetical protein
LFVGERIQLFSTWRPKSENVLIPVRHQGNKMKKLLLVSVIAVASFSATIGTSSAMPHSKYCMTNGYDPLCMSPKMLKMRMAMMKMDKATVMKNRSKYCRTSNGDDPICDPKMMHSSMGY